MLGYAILLAAVALERVAEMIVARRNLTWALRHGGYRTGSRHYPILVALHIGLLIGCAVEVPLAGRTFHPELGWPMLALVLAAQALRWWCIATLGRRWNTRIVVLPGMPLVRSGPYRALRHPNYLAVVAEGLALPLVHTAWSTAAVFTVVNAGALTVRIRAENAALTAGSTTHG